MSSTAPLADVVPLEAGLIDRARAGDVRAFERLYRAHVGRVHGLCLRMLRDAAAAEDCTQQAFIRAWSSLASFETRSAFGTWLHRIAVNVVLDDRRRRSSGPAATGERGEPVSIVDTPVEVDDIEAAILSLPDGARDVLVLCGLHGHSHAEAAAMLGVAEGTCKAQLHRARRLLRERLNLEET